MKKIMFKKICMIPAIALLLVSCQRPDIIAGDEWMPLFDGKDLSGWDIKIAGHPLNDNYKNTFMVQDSILRVVYDQYEKFDGRFAHIYTQAPYSFYKLRFQYRFTGKHLADAPVWADRNSGIMVHSQSA